MVTSEWLWLFLGDAGASPVSSHVFHPLTWVWVWHWKCGDMSGAVKAACFVADSNWRDSTCRCRISLSICHFQLCKESEVVSDVLVTWYCWCCCCWWVTGHALAHSQAWACGLMAPIAQKRDCRSAKSVKSVSSLKSTLLLISSSRTVTDWNRFKLCTSFVYFEMATVSYQRNCPPLLLFDFLKLLDKSNFSNADFSNMHSNWCF